MFDSLYEEIITNTSELMMYLGQHFFIEVIKGKPTEIANIDEGMDVIKILEMASKSLNLKNKQ